MSEGASTTLAFPQLDPQRNVDAVESTPQSVPSALRVEDVYVALKRRVYNFAYSLERDREVAEDMMQEAFLRFHGHGVKVETTDQAFGWLATVVRNLSRDRYRRTSIRPIAESPEGEGHIVDFLPHPGPSQEDLVIRTQRLDQLFDGLEGIERQCILLYGQGLKFHEIATTLGVSLNKAVTKTRLGLRIMNRNASRLKS